MPLSIPPQLGGGGGGEGNVKVEPDTATKDPEVPLTPGANSSLLEAIELTTAGGQD